MKIYMNHLNITERHPIPNVYMPPTENFMDAYYILIKELIKNNIIV